MLRTYGIFLVTVIASCNAQVPRDCARNFTLKTGVCCPLSNINQQVCGFPQRGICVPVTVYEDAHDILGFKDIRLRWPTQWFEYLCQCLGNYFGPSCDECWYGWSSDDCSQRSTVVRRNVLTLTKTEKKQFINVLQATRDEEAPYLLVKEKYQSIEESLVPATVHEVIVNMHFLAQRYIIAMSPALCDNVPVADFAHADIGFVTFHRHFMLFWEKWAADIARRKYGLMNFSFPYWDWTNKKICDVCTDDLIGSEGEASIEGSFYLSSGSPFHAWVVYCDVFDPKEEFIVNNCAPCSISSQSERLTRKVSASMLPTSEHVMFTLSRKTYAPTMWFSGQSQCPAFSKALEGVCSREVWGLKHTMHNAVHDAIVGPFSSSSTSPNDPLFILHHTQIDRLFQRWWLSHSDAAKKYPISLTPGHCFFCNQVGFIPAVTHEKVFVDSADLGYKYDSLLFDGQ